MSRKRPAEFPPEYEAYITLTKLNRTHYGWSATRKDGRVWLAGFMIPPDHRIVTGRGATEEDARAECRDQVMKNWAYVHKVQGR